jgi:hypothetical protein
VPHIVQPRSHPRRSSSARGCATTAPSPPLAGDHSGPTTTAYRSRLRPIATLGHMFTCTGPTSPAASFPPPSGAWLRELLVSRV